MHRPLLFAALSTTLLATGCLPFGEDVDTATPTQAQVDRCRAEMYLNPAVRIVPLGFRLHGSGIDDRIWFMFRAHTRSPRAIFDPAHVDPAAFRSGFRLPARPDAPAWWDAPGKEFLGGTVELPNARFMTVAMRRGDDGLVVYVLWSET